MKPLETQDLQQGPVQIFKLGRSHVGFAINVDLNRSFRQWPTAPFPGKALKRLEKVVGVPAVGKKFYPPTKHRYSAEAFTPLLSFGGRRQLFFKNCIQICF